MKPPTLAALAIAVLVFARTASAHPAPFSYVDVRIEPRTVEVIVTAHVFDLAHDLQIARPERLLEPAFLAEHNDAILKIFRGRLELGLGGAAAVSGVWSPPEALPDRQGVSARVGYELDAAPGALVVNAQMFPYDPAHETFVTIYEGDALAFQAILDRTRTRLEYFPGSRQGIAAMAARFFPVGFQHVLLGPDHLVLILGLLLLGGSARQLAALAMALVGGDLVALVLTTASVMQPPARLIEPAMALGIIYVGADNLLVKDGRDMRVWIAGALGLIHGFWFALGLRAMDLPPRALGWSLLSFDVGADMAAGLVIAVAGSAIILIRRRNGAAGRRLAHAGSAVVVAAGAFWFVQRVFFPGGIA